LPIVSWYYPGNGGKAEKTKNWSKIPLSSANQKTAFIYKVELKRIPDWPCSDKIKQEVFLYF
jgi:hypothetical protein